MNIRLFLILCFFCTFLTLEAATWELSDLGETAVFNMESAPFPHESRRDGYVYEDKVYPAEPHYIDNSVAIFIPDGYIPTEETDLIFYFHGWGNTHLNAMKQFGVTEQVVEGGKNVILVCPEGPMKSFDSGLGKLEDKDGLKNLVTEVIDTLYREKKIPSKDLGKVILSGASGGYRGVAFCLEVGGMDQYVTDVFLLDASYNNLEYFTNWMERVPEGRFHSIFTEHQTSYNTWMMATLAKKEIPFAVRLESQLEKSDLDENRLVFIYTMEKSHDQAGQLLGMFLRSSTLADRVEDTLISKD
jgi:hypothetical protein